MPASSSSTAARDFGSELRQWREVRRLSQLALSAEAEVSQRHLSFLETGKSRPSREMVIHLANVLDLPLRERNSLLTAAGYAPLYGERDLDDAAMEQVRSVLQRLLAAHDPYPAYVIDRQWNLVLANESAAAVMAVAITPQTPPEVLTNIARFALHPYGARPVVANWEQFAGSVLDRLEREVHHNPRDAALNELHAELLADPDVARVASRRPPPAADALLVPIEVRAPGVELSLFTTIATIGAPFDVTLEELRLETLLPADERSERTLRGLATQR
jgi:transcriptional regulator with XRE-family HTH domain